MYFCRTKNQNTMDTNKLTLHQATMSKNLPGAAKCMNSVFSANVLSISIPFTRDDSLLYLKGNNYEQSQTEHQKVYCLIITNQLKHPSIPKSFPACNRYDLFSKRWKQTPPQSSRRWLPHDRLRPPSKTNTNPLRTVAAPKQRMQVQV